MQPAFSVMITDLFWECFFQALFKFFDLAEYVKPVYFMCGLVLMGMLKKEGFKKNYY